MTGRGIQGLAEGLAENKSIEVIDLSENVFTEEAVRKLGDALLINTTLTSLYLYKNSIMPKGVRLLRKSILGNRNSALSTLSLSYNTLKDDGAKDVARIIGECRHLTSLELQYCEIRQAGSKALLAALRANRSVVHLEIGANSAIPSETMHGMLRTTEANQTLSARALVNWMRIVVTAAFLAANETSSIKFSILSLMSEVLLFYCGSLPLRAVAQLIDEPQNQPPVRIRSQYEAIRRLFKEDLINLDAFLETNFFRSVLAQTSESMKRRGRLT